MRKKNFGNKNSHITQYKIIVIKSELEELDFFNPKKKPKILFKVITMHQLFNILNSGQRITLLLILVGKSQNSHVF